MQLLRPHRCQPGQLPGVRPFCETTIGYKNDTKGVLFQKACDDPALKVGIVKDTVDIELCGALEDIVAVGAGFCDGLG